MLHKGIITKSTGSWYHVRLSTGEELPSRIVGKFRKADKRLTNPIAVGDEVEVEFLEEEERKGLIKNILPRRNYVVRQSPRKKHELHAIASNIDQAALVITIVQPKLKQGFIDRFLMMTEPFNIPTIIFFHKAYLYTEDDRTIAKYLCQINESICYTCLLVSSQSGEGISTVQSLFKDKKTLISGQSGVGKSTLINVIEAGLDIKTHELSDYSGKGQHTTTFAEMHPLSFGGDIIDTPGIKTLSFNYLEPIDVAHNFKEFFELSKHCKFGGSCMHRSEPKCAVKAAVESGEASELRYMNYLTLLGETEDQNYWERRDT